MFRLDRMICISMWLSLSKKRENEGHTIMIECPCSKLLTKHMWCIENSLRLFIFQVDKSRCVTLHNAITKHIFNCRVMI